MFILNSIAPIFLLIALGSLLRRTGFFSESFFKSINRLVYWIALPALLISRIATARLEPGTFVQITMLFTLATLCSLLLAWVISSVMHMPRRSKGAFIQGAFRGNGAFVALPVILYTLSDLDPAAASLATLTLAPVVILFNILSVGVLIHYSGQRQGPAQSIVLFFRQMIQNPLLCACALGLALNLLAISLPPFLNRTLTSLGNAALPMVLMSIGAGLALERLKGAASPSLVSSLLKVLITPLIGFLLAGLFPLSRTEVFVALVYLAAPTAGMSYVMAEVLDSDAPLAGRIIVLSTLLSAVTLPIIIALGL